MNELKSNQAPATPGTAARCEVCNREVWSAHAAQSGGWTRDRIEASCDRLNGDHNAGRADCFEHAYERLKAENASLLESLRAVEQLAESRGRMLSDSLALHEQANQNLFAAEQRAEVAEKALRQAYEIGERAVKEAAGECWRQSQDKRFAYEVECAGMLSLGALRAALHDEERSAPPPEDVK